MQKLRYVGTDGWDRPMYKDDSNRLWKDVNLGNGKPYLHRAVGDGPDGEPDYPITGDYEIISRPPNEADSFRYRMLSRLKMDCEYYLGHGNRQAKHLCYQDAEEHIMQMKQIWNMLPDSGKPEWLTMEQIEQYEKEMLATCP